MEDKLTSKIRESIKEKLVQLDAFLDDELPDYIMVMVANKRTQDCMNNELSLFLKENTSIFTTWLHNMLDTIQMEASSLSKNHVDVPDWQNENSTTFDDDVLDIQEQDDDMLSKELHGEVIKNEPDNIKISNATMKPNIVTMPPSPVKPTPIGSVKSKIAIQKQSPQKVKVKSKATVTSLKRIAEVSIDDEYDPLHPSVKSVASFVPVCERKSSVPASLQANKLLLFKAIDDANKSILGNQNIDEAYKPTPIKVLASSFKKYRKTVSDANSKEMFAPSAKRFASGTMENLPVFITKPNFEPTLFEGTLPQNENLRSVRISSDMTDNEDIVMEEEFSDEVDSGHSDSSRSVHPHFVVTLDGLDVNNFKDKWSPTTISKPPLLEVEFSDDSSVEDSASEIAVKNEKLPDKCRYWPVCRHGENCLYLHPKTPCKSFPNCNFGEKCHFIHPNCMFDSLCNRKDCPYTHKVKKDLVGSTVSPSFLKMVPEVSHQTTVCKFDSRCSRKDCPYTHKSRKDANFSMSVSQVPYQNTVCKYFPKCNLYNCPYLHPKKCKFGNMCKSPTCPFTHPLFPKRNQLKWKAGTSF